jgi:hypothetical protein
MPGGARITRWLLALEQQAVACVSGANHISHGLVGCAGLTRVWGEALTKRLFGQ